MNRRPLVRSRRLVVETLEGRTLLSGVTDALPAGWRSALIGPVRAGAIATDPGAIGAITSALNGGIGREWVSLIRGQVRTLGSVIAGFATGRYQSYSIAGLTAKVPNVQPQFTGRPYDQLLANVAGAAVFRRNVFELGAIMLGPFHNPETSYYVFALDRGAGARLGPRFASRPGITPDALVTLTVGPFGSSATGNITDLVTGSTEAIDPSNIVINGPTVRVFLRTSQFPSQGLALSRYRFAFWTQTRPGNGITTVASFAPESSMIRIGMLRSATVRR